MLIYYYFFILLFLCSIVEVHINRKSQLILIQIVSLLLILFIGSRLYLGGDYNSYFKFYHNLAAAESFFYSFTTSGGDLGYNFLSYLLFYFDFDLVYLNLICGIIVVIGISVFALDHKLPLLILLVSFPIFIIVVAMGYTRQAVAISFLLIAIRNLKYKNFIYFFMCICLASLFHKTAIILIPLAFLCTRDNRKLIFIFSVTIFLFLFYFLMYDEIFGMTSAYVQKQIVESKGALIRAIINFIPAVIFLKYQKIFTDNLVEKNIYFFFSIAAILNLPLVFYASTFFDRIGFYLFPLQFFVWGNIDKILDKINFRFKAQYSVGIYHFIILFVWLHYAIHSYLWIPYKSKLLLSEQILYNEKSKKFYNYRLHENENDRRANYIKFIKDG